MIHFISNTYALNIYHSLAVVVAQLVEKMLPTPEVRGSNSVFGKNCIEYCFLLTVFCKEEIQKKRPGMVHFKNKTFIIYQTQNE